jgi:hypothetical protein
MEILSGGQLLREVTIFYYTEINVDVRDGLLQEWNRFIGLFEGI